MIKIYSIRGQVESVRIFRLGVLSARCLFTGGSVNESGIVPAIYSTNNPITQAVIESSKLFKDGVVQLQESIEEESDLQVPDSESEGDDTSKSGMDFPEVTNSQAAKAILMAEPYNVPLVELQNKEATKAKAAELGVTFSNWN